MSRLLISAGKGPGECRLALRHFIAFLDAEVIEDYHEDRHGPASALLAVPSAADWHGVFCWRCKSPLRPQTKRQNWYFGATLWQDAVEPAPLRPQDLRFDTLRAGGPGGQHQNTTDSAVRVTHLPTGLSALARDQRSQHRNKAAALERLTLKLHARSDAGRAALDRAQHTLHQTLERGGARLVFKGPKFTLV